MTLPGEPVDVPLVPALCRTFGDARHVGSHWSPRGGQPVSTDGRSSGTGQGRAYLGSRRHRVVAPLLAAFGLGSPEEDVTHMPLVDQQARRAVAAGGRGPNGSASAAPGAAAAHRGARGGDRAGGGGAARPGGAHDVLAGYGPRAAGTVAVTAPSERDVENARGRR